MWPMPQSAILEKKTKTNSLKYSQFIVFFYEHLSGCDQIGNQSLLIDSEVQVSAIGGNSSTRGTLEVTLLNKIRL